MKTVYLIKNIAEYGKLISYCIYNDIDVFRTYWDEREAGDRCFHIDNEARRCFYAPRKFYEQKGFKIVEPVFALNKYGKYYFDVDYCEQFTNK